MQDFRDITGQGGPVSPENQKFVAQVLSGEKPIKQLGAPLVEASDSQQGVPSPVR